jgi:hypothetical protein
MHRSFLERKSMDWAKILAEAGIPEPMGRAQAVEGVAQLQQVEAAERLKAEQARREAAEEKLMAAAHRAARTRRRR